MRFVMLVAVALLTTACTKFGFEDQSSAYADSSLIAPILLPAGEATREFSPLYALPSKRSGTTFDKAPLPPVDGLASRPELETMQTQTLVAPERTMVFDENQRPIVFAKADLQTTATFAQQAFYNAGFGVQPSSDPSLFRIIDANKQSNLIYLVSGSNQTSVVVVTEDMQPEERQRALAVLNAALANW